MRLELALVFGILLFCCWCAYIIARMNASVGAPAPNSGADYVVRPNSSATYSTYSNYNPDPNQTILAALPSAAYSAQGQTHAGPDSAMAWQPHHATNMHPGSMGAHHHQQHHHQVHAPFARRPEASAPVARLVQVPGVGEQLEAPGGHVARAPYLSGIHQWPVAAGGAPAHWPGHAYPAPVGAPNLAAAAGPGRQPQSGAPDEAEQADDEGADNGLDQEAAPANDEPAGDESGDEQPRAELDEVVGRRSFSEDELDANERDRAGNVIVAHKRHLINGRPVGAGSLKANRTNWAPDSEATRPAANQADDFDKLVSEIDGERRRHKSRRSGGAPTRRRGPDGEQQESDDAEEQSNDPATGAERRQDSADMLSSDKPGASDDSLNSAGGAELDANEQEGAEDTQAAGTAPPTTGRPADSHEHRLHETLSAQQWDDDSTLGAGKARPGASDEPPDVVGQDEEARGLEELARDLLLGAHERRKRHADSSGRPGEPGARVVPAAGARNKRARAARASQGPAGSERDTLVGQEDISIEVLASGVPGAPGQPDAANQSQPLAGAYYQLPSAAPPVSLQPVVAPSGHLAGPMNQFPQIASPFASDTHTDETKRRKQKSNKSKMTSSKYKAAKAFADKHERRQKKGEQVGGPIGRAIRAARCGGPI